MPRVFNTTGPCNPEKHYMLAPEARMPALLPLVEGELYFVVHAARQTGKTTAMRAFATRLRGLGYCAVYATLETTQGMSDVADAEPLWIQAIRHGASFLPPEDRPPAALDAPSGGQLGALLQAWSRALAAGTPAKTLVVLLDEADVVSGASLVSLLRQLRAGFLDRPLAFPRSIALVGMRDLRDYLAAAKGGASVNPGSPFNVKAASLTLRNFTHAEVAELYGQHTSETGQVFLPETVERAFGWTQGQPFLVNALARIAVMELATDGVPVSVAHLEEAKERLVLSRTTHLDALAERLKEPRVARIVEAVLTGDLSISYDSDDFNYAVDLGLIRKGRDGAEVSCPLYREVLARQLAYNVQENLPRPRWRWQTASGGLDMPALVEAFRRWWRENADILHEQISLGYGEALAHLAFMGFLQRVINGGGRVTREFAAGRRALELLVEFGDERHVVELKRVPPTRRSLETVREEGVGQLCDYLDVVGEKEGWLLIFDQRPGRSWEERLWEEERLVGGRTIHLRGA